MATTSGFRDQTVIITGASSGLGAALALAFADAGANLALFSFEKERQEEVADQVRQRGARARVVIGDVTVPDDCQRLVDDTVSEFGGIGHLIANAGISMWARFEDIQDLAVMKRLVDVNYMGVVNCVHYALPHLKSSGGMIVAITSIQSRIGVPAHTGYVASKHALQGFCEALRMELDGTGVDILTVLPHWLRGTELRKHAFDNTGKELGDSSARHTSESVSVEEACDAILKAMAKRKRELIIPWKLKLLSILYQIWPARAEALIMGAVGKEER